MTEEDAQQWLAGQGWWDGPAGERLRHFVELVLEESERQNLISAGTRNQIWARHIVDSAQLLPISEAHGGASSPGPWVDLGSGAGFPGLVIACLQEQPVQLVEMRPGRATFLERCIGELGLVHTTVAQLKVQNAVLPTPARVISARAYAPLDRLLDSAIHLADENTVWLLPKGRSAENELAFARREWQGVFHVEQSITARESSILVIRGVRRKAKSRDRQSRR